MNTINKNDLIGKKFNIGKSQVKVVDFDDENLVVKDNQGNEFTIKDSRISLGDSKKIVNYVKEVRTYGNGDPGHPEEIEYGIFSDISGDQITGTIYSTPDGDVCSEEEANEYDLSHLRKIENAEELEKAKKIIAKEYDIYENELDNTSIWFSETLGSYVWGSLAELRENFDGDFCYKIAEDEVELDEEEGYPERF